MEEILTLHVRRRPGSVLVAAAGEIDISTVPRLRAALDSAAAEGLRVIVDTRFGVGTILRASAAINDSLRQLGHLGLYETLDSLPDLEQIGIWLHHDGAICIPLVIRLDVSATAYLASDKGTATPPIPYEDLPEALANGKGRIRSGPQQKAHVASFLRNARGTGTGTGTGDSGSRDTLDRVVFVRSFPAVGLGLAPGQAHPRRPADPARHRNKGRRRTPADNVSARLPRAAHHPSPGAEFRRRSCPRIGDHARETRVGGN